MSSIFTEQPSNQESVQPEQVTQTTEQPSSSFVDKLVQAKGDNWRDPEVLAKGKLEADSYIQQLEGQITQMREDLSKQDYAAQVLEELRGRAADTSTAKTSEAKNDTAGMEETDTPSAPNEDNLKSLVNQALEERERQAKIDRNLQTVQEELKSRFGEGLGNAVNTKAEELGMSLQRMEQIASESPSAFLALFGERQEPAVNNLLSSSINTEGANMQASTERNWQYYQKLRRDNRNLYYTPKIQQQLIADKQRLGEKFGN